MYKNIFKETGLNFIITILIGFLSFGLNSIFAQKLGSENLGLMRLFTQLIAYLNLVEMGVGTATAFSLYKPLLDKDSYKISVILNTIEKLYSKVCYAVLFVGFVLTLLLPTLNNNISIKSIVSVYWLVYVLNTALSYKYAKYPILYTADQNFRYVRLIQGLSKILVLICQIAILIYFKSFILFVLLISFENIIQYIFYKKYYLKNYAYVTSTQDVDLVIKKNIFNLFWHKLGGVIIFNTDYIILSKFISLSAVGVYSTYILVINMLTTILMTILNVLNPKIGKFIAQNNKKNIYNLWKKLNIVIVFIGNTFVLITYLNISSFVFLWMGKEFVYTKEMTILLMINLFIQLTRGITDSFKNNSGFYDDIHLPIIESFLNLVTSIILVKYIGIEGVVIGTIISNIVVIYFWSPILTFKRCFDKTGFCYLKKLFSYIFILFINSLINIFFIKKLNLELSLSWKIFVMDLLKTSTLILGLSSIVFLLHKDFRKNIYLIVQFLKK
ncbi:MAG: lipopolysaccharide biosynthesis protein [Fusobacteriaceae bacterium]